MSAGADPTRNKFLLMWYPEVKHFAYLNGAFSIGKGFYDLKNTVQNEWYLQENANHCQAVLFHESFFKTFKLATVPMY